VKVEDGAACFAGFEVGAYKEIRAEPFDAAAFRELKQKYMHAKVRPRDTGEGEAADLHTPKAPVDNYPVLAPVIRQAISERDDEVWGFENKFSTNVEYPHPPPRMCMIIRRESKSGSDVGRVIVLNDPSMRALWCCCGSSGKAVQVKRLDESRVESAGMQHLKPKYDKLPVKF
jgi:hypothetical protein